MTVYHEPATDCSFPEFKKVVESRRSVRKFTNKPIPDEIVNQCLDLALLAPTSSNLQCWEFYWVKTPAIKTKLAEHCFNQSAARTAATLIVAVARTKSWPRIRQQMLAHLKTLPPNKGLTDYYEKVVPFVYGQGPFSIFWPIKKLILFTVGLFRVVPREPVGRKEMITWASKTVALACENLMLAFRAAGYDTCPMEGFDEHRVRKLLKLPGDAKVVMVIGAGEREVGGVYGERIRFDRSQFIREL